MDLKFFIPILFIIYVIKKNTYFSGPFICIYKTNVFYNNKQLYYCSVVNKLTQIV